MKIIHKHNPVLSFILFCLCFLSHTDIFLVHDYEVITLDFHALLPLDLPRFI